MFDVYFCFGIFLFLFLFLFLLNTKPISPLLTSTPLSSMEEKQAVNIFAVLDSLQ